jgi:hypothetical protein
LEEEEGGTQRVLREQKEKKKGKISPLTYKVEVSRVATESDYERVVVVVPTSDEY